MKATPCYNGPARKYWICRADERISGPYTLTEAEIYQRNTEALTGELLEIRDSRTVGF